MNSRRNLRSTTTLVIGALTSVLIQMPNTAFADTEFKCEAQPLIFAHNARSGDSFIYPAVDYGTSKSTYSDRWSVPADVKGHVIRTGTGLLYSWANKDLFRHKYEGGSFIKSAAIPAPNGALGQWGVNDNTPVAVDQANNIFVVEANTIRRYSLNADASSWTTWNEEIPLPAGSIPGQIRHIFASDMTRIFVKNDRGEMFRFKYDQDSHRVISAPERLGIGWGLPRYGKLRCWRNYRRATRGRSPSLPWFG